MKKRVKAVMTSVPQPLGASPYFQGYQGYGRSDVCTKADAMRKRLLSEADLLTAIGDPRGERLRAIALELPIASLERL